ncbi:pentatricopeptide repeat-containing protein At3g02650, mitochondrial [Brassica rapa]|uniref:Pentacotripeptide-repeat region of PRORP domain-containing protein n=1 Tax=Brassica campestris TaxID=3711 RepID=M4DY26_BRACM|nr:pentatricopeptide repeat-containing protein At3g02650, mitochondrial [Brassica rapa]
MLRSVLRRSQNLAFTRISTKKTPSPTSISRFAHAESPGNASPRSLRFFSTDEIPISSSAELTHEESNPPGLGLSESGDFDVNGEDGESNVATVEDSGDGSVVAEEVSQFDEEKFESLLSLLRSDEEALEFGLKALDLDLNSALVSRVFESPGISGKNLIRFLKWATKKEEINVTTSLLESLLVVVSGDRRRLDAYALWDLVKEISESESSLVLNLEIMNDLIALFGKLGKSKAAFDAFSKTEELGFTPSAKTYYVTLEALCKRSFMEWACVVCEKMLKSGVLPEGDQIGNIITWFCKEGKAEEAYSVYELAKAKEKLPPSRSVATLISSLSKNDGTVGFAQELLSDLSGDARRQGIKPFSDVVQSLCRMKNVKDAKGLVLDMISKGPAPGNAVFNLIVHACSRSRDLDEAKEVLKLMESRGLKPDVYTYTVIISGYAKGGMMNDAREILAEAKKKHKNLSPVMYHSLIRGYCKIEEYDEALKLLNEMESFGVKPSADEYSKLIQSFCLKALDWEKAEMLFEEMKQKGLHLNAITQGLIRAVKEMQTEGKGTEDANLLAAA